MDNYDITEVVKHYLICALWSSNDESDESGGEPMDSNYDLDDIHPTAYATATEDCTSFLMMVSEAKIDTSWWTSEQMGHDFWLTRCHHGAGFWDRGQGAAGDALTKIAHTFSDGDLYVGDDGLVYSA